LSAMIAGWGLRRVSLSPCGRGWPSGLPEGRERVTTPGARNSSRSPEARLILQEALSRPLRRRKGNPLPTRSGVFPASAILMAKSGTPDFAWERVPEGSG
jgi:hypothetical protein